MQRSQCFGNHRDFLVAKLMAFVHGDFRRRQELETAFFFKVQLNYGLFVNYNQYTEFDLVNRMILQEFEIARIFQMKEIYPFFFFLSFLIFTVYNTGNN